MIKRLFYIFLILLFTFQYQAFAHIDKIPDLKGFADTRGAYGDLDTFNGSVTFADTNPDQIQATGIGTGLEAGNSVEVLGSSGGQNDAIYMISSVAADALTVTSALIAEGPTASVDVDQVPTICIVDDITDNNGTLADGTRNGNPVKLGSLLESINATQKNKIIIFEVSGTINETGGNYTYTIDERYTEIRGETAPSPGITLRNAKLRVKVSDVVITHLRVRTGDSETGVDPGNRDAITIGGGATGNVQNVIIDHGSFSWGVDENGSIFDTSGGIVAYITISNSIFAEGLSHSLHPDTMEDGSSHSKGMQISGSGVSENIAVLRNVFAHHVDRTPRVAQAKNVVLANNFNYNSDWYNIQLHPYDMSTPIYHSFFGNAGVGGPDSSGTSCPGADTVRCYWMSLVDSAGAIFEGDPPGTGVYVHTQDNRVGYYSGGSIVWKKIQSAYDDWDGVKDSTGENVIPNMTKESTPTVSISGYITLDSADVLAHVVDNAGARPADRDQVDLNIIEDIRTGTGGIIDSVTFVEDDCVGFRDPIGCCTGVDSWICVRNDIPGWPSLAENTDTHNDLPAGPHADSGDGYTNLEKWIQGFAAKVEGNIDRGSNDFSWDSSVIAVYRFETDAMLTDSQGSETLTAGVIPDYEITNHQEGFSAADFESGDSEYLYRTNASLVSTFWGKQETGGFGTRFDPESTGSITYLAGKWGSPTAERSWRCGINDVNKGLLTLQDSVGGHNFTHPTPFDFSSTYDRWYIYSGWDATTDTAYIRCRQRNASTQVWEVVGTDKIDSATMSGESMQLGTGDFHVGQHGSDSAYWDGIIDESIIMSRVLTAQEVTDICNFSYHDTAIITLKDMEISGTTANIKIGTGIANIKFGN